MHRPSRMRRAVFFARGEGIRARFRRAQRPRPPKFVLSFGAKVDLRLCVLMRTGSLTQYPLISSSRFQNGVSRNSTLRSCVQAGVDLRDAALQPSPCWSASPDGLQALKKYRVGIPEDGQQVAHPISHEILRDRPSFTPCSPTGPGGGDGARTVRAGRRPASSAAPADRTRGRWKTAEANPRASFLSVPFLWTRKERGQKSQTCGARYNPTPSEGLLALLIAHSQVRLSPAHLFGM